MSATAEAGQIRAVRRGGLRGGAPVSYIGVEMHGGHRPHTDSQGYLRIEEGDVVSVRGTMDLDFFEGRELVASSVVELVD